MEIGAIIIAAVGSTALFNFIQFLLNRKDKKEDDLADIRADLKEIKARQIVSEKDSCRTQILLLMADYPDNVEEMMKLSEHYFSPTSKGGLGANWYMTSLFSTWLKKHNIQEPLWFQKGESK